MLVSADFARIDFHCTLTLNGVAQPEPACDEHTAPRTDGTLGTKGSVTLPALAASPKAYVLTVTAHVPPLTPGRRRAGRGSW